jgi:hypothetical protein
MTDLQEGADDDDDDDDGKKNVLTRTMRAVKGMLRAWMVKRAAEDTLSQHLTSVAQSGAVTPRTNLSGFGGAHLVTYDSRDDGNDRASSNMGRCS